MSQIGHVAVNDYVHRVACMPEGAWVAACSASGQVVVWDAASLSVVRELNGHRSAALTMGWHPKRPELATGGQDGVVRIWEVPSGQERAVLPVGGQGAWVEHLAWSRDGWFLAAAAGKTLRIWKSEREGSLELAGEVFSQTTISDLAWMPKGEAVIASAYGGAWLWQIGHERPRRTFPYTGAVLAIAVSPSGEYLASGNLDGSVHLFRTDDDRQWHMSGYPVKVSHVRFDQSGLHLFTAAGSDLVSWNMNRFEGTGGRLFIGHEGWIQDLTCHPTRSLVATVGEEGRLCVWEPRATTPLFSIEVGRGNALSCVTWSHDGQWLITGAADGVVQVFSVHDGDNRARVVR
ncbi:MAG: hypothetical protein NNA20_06000 [Nitrospira sp.]|nr:hypothetical protein [Nitrospira sp.]